MNQTAIGGGDQATLVSSASAFLLGLRPYTIVRTRGIIAVVTDQITNAENQELLYGHCVVSDQASAIGVTAVPTPDTDTNSDLWYVYEAMVNRNSFISAVGNEKLIEVHRFDSKAMRKVQEGEDDIMVVESSAASSGMTLTTQFRQLIKLH